MSSKQTKQKINSTEKDSGKTKQISPKVPPKLHPRQNSPKLDANAWRKPSPSGSTHSSSSSDDGRPESGDLTDSRTQHHRRSPKQKVSLNLGSKNNPLNPKSAFKDILPGGKPKLLCESSESKTAKDDRNPREGEQSQEDKSIIERKTKKETTKTDIDEEFRQKVKRMDYNTVYMMAQRTKGPQQYKYRKILQEMYDEQNK